MKTIFIFSLNNKSVFCKKVKIFEIVKKNNYLLSAYINYWNLGSYGYEIWYLDMDMDLKG